MSTRFVSLVALALVAGVAPAQERIEVFPLDDPAARNQDSLLPNGERARPRLSRPGDPNEDGDRFAVAPFRTDPYATDGTAARIRIGATEGLGAARLRVLDMITGETETLTLGVGDRVEHRRLTLSLAACTRPEREEIGDLALLEVVDRRRADEGPAFSGWMFAESPALSALDHPRYDVWLIACTTASAGDGEGSDQNSAGQPSASSSSAR